MPEAHFQIKLSAQQLTLIVHLDVIIECQRSAAF